ncbi:MAG TPA: hypothetical protein VMT63_12315 [Bacteroidales bacterium]|nr:hypothetical protein [Bacteroidales bacterium]
MKRIFILVAAILGFLAAFASCNNNTERKTSSFPSAAGPDTAGLILVGKGIITDIVLKPDSTGDPWEVEKVKGFTGEKMFRTLFENIHNGSVTVYDVREDKALKVKEVSELEKEFNSDLSRIGKVQFTEDWYFDPARNFMIKKIKSVSFGFSLKPEGEMATRYKALFRLR